MNFKVTDKLGRLIAIFIFSPLIIFLSYKNKNIIDSILLLIFGLGLIIYDLFCIFYKETDFFYIKLN